MVGQPAGLDGQEVGLGPDPPRLHTNLAASASCLQTVHFSHAWASVLRCIILAALFICECIIIITRAK